MAGGIFCVKVGALEGRGEEAIAEVVFSGAGHAAGVVDGDEGREVFVVGAQSVSDP